MLKKVISISNHFNEDDVDDDMALSEIQSEESASSKNKTNTQSKKSQKSIKVNRAKIFKGVYQKLKNSLFSNIAKSPPVFRPLARLLEDSNSKPGRHQ